MDKTFNYLPIIVIVNINFANVKFDHNIIIIRISAVSLDIANYKIISFIDFHPILR